MKTIAPPLGLLEFIERVGSRAKIYQVGGTPDQLTFELGCCDQDVLSARLILRPTEGPRIIIGTQTEQPTLKAGEILANRMQVYLLTGYQSEWLPPFGHPCLFPTELSRSIIDSPCLYIPGGVENGWLAVTFEELKCLTDFDHWSKVFAA